MCSAVFLAVMTKITSEFSRLVNLSSIYVYVSDSSMHVQRLVQGAAAFAKLQSPRLRLMWGSILMSKRGIDLNNIQGIIYFALREGELEQLESFGLPMVNVSARNLPTPHASVTPDDHAIGLLAARHFKEHLYQNFAFIGLTSHRYSLVRGNAFAEGIFPSECHSLWLEEIDDPAHAESKIKHFLQKLPTPTAILASNDLFARRICELAMDLGLNVPEQLAILGVDAEQMISLASPVQLSSIDIDSFKIGYTAVETLYRLIRDPESERTQVVIPPKGVLVASSTDHLATEDPIVAKTVALIREYACNGLTVEDIASKVGVGRRMLERRFRKAIGRGVDEQIRKIRVERAIELLERSDFTISEIAEHCGFSDVFYFSKVFKKTTTRSPREYRQA
jgi:LacI family transcriptional regulator